MSTSFASKIASIWLIAQAATAVAGIQHEKYFLDRRKATDEHLSKIDWNKGPDPASLVISLEFYDPKSGSLTTIKFGSGNIEGFFGVLVECDRKLDISSTPLKISKENFDPFMLLIENVEFSELQTEDPFMWIPDSLQMVFRFQNDNERFELVRFGFFHDKKLDGPTKEEFLEGTAEAIERVENADPKGRSVHEIEFLKVVSAIVGFAKRFDIFTL